jgi:uncharacterized coiled-coil DUF342 family protein
MKYRKHIKEHEHIEELKHKFYNLRRQQREAQTRYLSTNDEQWKQRWQEITNELDKTHDEMLLTMQYVNTTNTRADMLTDEGREWEMKFREEVRNKGIKQQHRAKRNLLAAAVLVDNDDDVETANKLVNEIIDDDCFENCDLLLDVTYI